MRLLIACLGLVLLLIPHSAAACSLVPPTFEFYEEHSAIIAIGTFVESEEHVASFEVATYLKGETTQPVLTILNHSISNLSPSCGVTLGAGQRFEAGVQALVFLEPAPAVAEADWQPYGVMLDGVWTLDGDGITVYDATFSEQTLTLEEAQKQLEALTGSKPYTPEPANSDPGTTAVQEQAGSLPLVPVLIGGLALIAGIGAAWGWQRSRQTT